MGKQGFLDGSNLAREHNRMKLFLKQHIYFHPAEYSQDSH